METIREIKSWFEKAVPEPSIENCSVQIGCHFEEVAEMVDALGFTASYSAHELALMFKSRSSPSIYTLERLDEKQKVDLLDALCDQIVTAVGVACMMGFDIEAALREVNRSNWSKFDEAGNPIFDRNGKIKKGEGYTPPDLESYI